MLKAHGHHIVVVKGTAERFEHPLMKALLWALYLPQHPLITIEIHIGDRYKPDVVAFDLQNLRLRPNEPAFWGEAGSVGRDKIESILKRYPDTHFAFARWAAPLKPRLDVVQAALKGVKRTAPVDIISFPDACLEAIDDDGNIQIVHDDLIWQRL
jgi:hypothetical protein